jgi:hypothetical protein
MSRPQLTLIDHMMRECERAPTQRFRRLVLADYLEEHGARLMALALRYAGTHDLLPIRVSIRRSGIYEQLPEHMTLRRVVFAWYAPNNMRGKRTQRATLSEELYLAAWFETDPLFRFPAITVGNRSIFCSNRWAAWTCLGALLDKLKIDTTPE